MKLLITTPDALLDNDTGEFFPDILDVLNNFNNSEDNGIVVISQSGKGLGKIPKNFNPLRIKSSLRGSPKLIQWLKDKLELETQDIFVLGCKDKDVHQAANSKLLLLRADYAEDNNPDSMIYDREYGIGIGSPEKLGNFLDTLDQFAGEWYYKLEVSEKSVVYALTDANTKNKPQSESVLNNRFKRCLKDGEQTYRVPFMTYFLVSTYLIVKEFEQVDYWGIYPSSEPGANEDLEYFKDKARQSYKGVAIEPILIRTKAVRKRHFKSRDKRLEEGCDEQLTSIIINPYYKNKLKGKCVCIIDDFTTYGTSAETARTLLESAGAARVIFICLGKFGREYHKYNYELKGDVYSAFKFNKISRETMTGKFKAAANFEFIKTLRTLM